MRDSSFVSMRAVVARTMRDRFAAVLLAAASLPLVIALGMIVLPAIGGGSPVPPGQHLGALPPLTPSLTPAPPVIDMTTSTAPPDTPTPTPGTTPTADATPPPATDPFTDLCQQTKAGVHDSGLAGDLCHQLAEAEQHYSASDLHAEADAVRSYAAGVRGARRKSIDAATADALIAAANALPGIQSQSSD